MTTGRPRKTRGWVPRHERLKPAPPREPGESDADYFIRVLPTPPQVGADDVVAEWLADVIHVGGPAALQWAFEAHNWPEHLRQWRMRVDHVYHQLMRQGELAAVRERESAARQAQANAEQERLAKRRAAGWS